MTFKQAHSEGAQVRKGEKGSVVQYWKWEGLEPKLDENGKPVLDEVGKPMKVMVRYQRPRVWSAVVFNAEQIDNLPEPNDRPALNEWERHQAAESLLNASEARIDHSPLNQPCYRPAMDRISLPERGQFLTADHYYATALHELGHWTGHHSRLNRDILHPFGSIPYAKEELRAEIASLILGEQLAIGHDPGQHAAYIKSWIRVLEEDPREIFRAASDADQIGRFIRGLEQTQERSQEQPQNLENPEEASVAIQVPLLLEEGQMLQATSERTYLVVPYEEKNEAKALGARWDTENKAWYAPAGVHLDSLKRWMPDQDALHMETSRDPKWEFASALREAGLMIDGQPEMDGQLRRVQVEGDQRGQTSGAYVGFLDGHPAGFIQNFKTGLETNWKASQSVKTKALSARDRARLNAEAAQKRQERAKERELLAEQAALEAEAILAAAVPANEHPYLNAKGIQPHGAKQDAEGNLVIPVQDIDGKTASLQTIEPDGRKSFLKDGKIQGGFYRMGTLAVADKLLVCEGFATGATLHEATGLPVAVAFNSGNLLPVAQTFREQYPSTLIFIAGDNDHAQERLNKPNVGRQKAEEAAKMVDGHLLPEFDAGALGSDWNDLMQEKGVEAVRQMLQVGLAIGARETMTRQLSRASEEAVPPILAHAQSLMQHQEQSMSLSR
jgi:putative DNA primase/helicase